MIEHKHIIEGNNLSVAWIDAVNRILKSSGKEITPLLLTLTGFDEDPETRIALDFDLAQNRNGSIQTVAETIFPESLYELCGKDRFALYKQYEKNLPRIKKLDRRNARGTYFQRLIAFDGGDKKINQLEIIVSGLKSNKSNRRSKFQASTFDPKTDHTNGPFQGFPCLQHVTFYLSENGGLVLNSFYAIQYLYERGYGNWLGLINLGKFVANEVGIEFERFNCYIGVEKLETGKTEAKKLLQTIENSQIIL